LSHAKNATAIRRQRRISAVRYFQDSAFSIAAPFEDLFVCEQPRAQFRKINLPHGDAVALLARINENVQMAEFKSRGQIAPL
jgi:hypothetical protein